MSDLNLSLIVLITNLSSLRHLVSFFVSFVPEPKKMFLLAFLRHRKVNKFRISAQTILFSLSGYTNRQK